MKTLKFSLVLLVLSLGNAALAQKTAQPAAPAIPKHLAVAENLVANLNLANTNYEHGTPTVKFTVPVESHTDCSGFIDALLEHTYGFDSDTLKKWLDSSRPTARRYHDAIENAKGFKQIAHVQDILPGDILAVKYLKKSDNTGHVMLVADRPLQIQSQAPLMSGTLQWQVTVIDSSESGHGPTDTRHKQGPDGKDHDGLGKGVFRIYTDAQGSVVGFTWSTFANSKIRTPDDENLVIGRLELDDIAK